MKDIAPKLVQLLKLGYCTPQISRLAKKLQEPSTTIHYNIKKLEKDKVIAEDDKFRGIEELQKLVDKYIAKIEELLKNKEKEVLEF